MKKFVQESLGEFLNEANVKSKRKTKAGEKVTLDQNKNEKAKQAIKALEDQLADMKKKGGGAGTKVQKDDDVKRIKDKIAAWKKKM